MVAINLAKLLVFEFCNGLRENFLIGFVAQILHKTALLGTQQIACAADIQVLHGQMKTTPQLGKVLQSLQSAARLGREHTLWRCQQIAERLFVAASYASAHLVKVAQAKPMRIINDNGVGIADIDAVFNDGGREEHVVIVVHEAHDDFFQLIGFHLPVTDGNAAVGHIFLDEVGYLLQAVDAIVHKINLAVAAHFEIDGVGYHLMPKGGKLGMDGITVGRRRADNAHVARSHQRELQRARYGRGRHGERVDVGFEFPQFLFGGDTKLLFLVDDE